VKFTQTATIFKCYVLNIKYGVDDFFQPIGVYDNMEDLEEAQKLLSHFKQFIVAVDYECFKSYPKADDVAFIVIGLEDGKRVIQFVTDETVRLGQHTSLVGFFNPNEKIIKKLQAETLEMVDMILFESRKISLN